MALGQLQHLEALFIKTGWLAAQCKSFNKKNARAIANGTKFRQNSNLYALDTFVVTPMSKPGICKARENDKLRTIAEAHRKSSFSELVNPFGLLVHCFVSHYWGHDFSSTVMALDLWADANYDRMTSEKQSLVYWICLFALNQHNVAEEVGENPQQGPFNAALAQATGGAVMVLDEEIRPFSRIWCLFEISRLKDLQQPFELICSEGSLSQPERFGNQTVSIEMLEATCEALWNVSAAKAQSSVEADKYQIWAETADKYVKGDIAACGAQGFFQAHIDQYGAQSLDMLFTDFDKYIKSLLSTTMLQILLAKGQCAAAVQCCLYGASFGPEDLTAICSIFDQEVDRKKFLCNLLGLASNASTACLLLERGADAGAADNNGVTALMAAAAGGHEAMAHILLHHGATAGAADNDGWTALMDAAAGGHVTMAQLLLDHGADTGAADSVGRTALMAAAAGGHEAMAQLLLDHGAKARAARNDGVTALMIAAADGHVTMAELLLEHGAEARVARNDGVTALMAAAEGGHEAIAQLLLKHGADAGEADNNGSTALMAAAAGGHEAMAALLLEHGADARAASNAAGDCRRGWP